MHALVKDLLIRKTLNLDHVARGDSDFPSAYHLSTKLFVDQISKHAFRFLQYCFRYHPNRMSRASRFRVRAQEAAPCRGKITFSLGSLGTVLEDLSLLY